MKLMVVLDFIRLNYVNDDGEFVFLNTRAGKRLTKIITSKKFGLALDSSDVDISFAYPRVPPLTVKGKPKNITQTMGKPYFEKLQEHIVEYKPDMIISFGNTAVQGLLGKKGIDKLRGIPVHKNFSNKNNEEFETWVVPMYGLESVDVEPSRWGTMSKDVDLVRKIIHEGIESISSGVGKYELVTDINRVKDIFSNILVKKKYSIVAVDFETNTLHGQYHNVPNRNNPEELVSAKPIILSISWEEGQGVSIPVDHQLASWTPDQLAIIHELIKQLFMSEQWKVLHNGIFDITFLKETIGLKYSKNCVDTLLMYYIGVTEETDITKTLKGLAYQYTNMGGYESPLDDYKRNFLSERHNAWIAKMEKRKEETGEKYRKTDYVPLVNEIDGGDFNYEWIPLEIIYPYAAADTDACLRIYNKLKKIIKDNAKWTNLIYNYYPKLQDALSEAMKNGVKIDEDYANRIKPIYEDELNKILEEIRKIPEVKEFESRRLKIISDGVVAKKTPKKDRTDEQDKAIKEANKLRGVGSDGRPKYMFNPGSSNDKKYVLYFIMGMTLPDSSEFYTDTAKNNGKIGDKATWESYKTDKKAAIPYLKANYDSKLPELLERYSSLATVLKDFIVKLPKILDTHSLAHTRFIMTGTVTSRLASSGDYNVQQLPRRTADPGNFKYHYPVKGMVTSRFNHGVILNIDFATLEIYVAAMVSQDKGMEQILLDGKDYHSATARNIFNIPDDKEVLKDVRSQAKAASFGTIYGEGPAGLASSEKISLDEATRVIDGLMKAYPRLESTIKYYQDMARYKGYVETISGYRRRLGTVKSKDKGKASRALRQSFNAVIQGSGAYCTNSALIKLHEYFLKLNLKSLIVATVHDSVVIDTHPDEVNKVATICQYVFSHLDIPEVVNNDIGDLRVPDELKLPNNKFRFPLHGEVEIGENYNNDVEYDPDELAKFKHPDMYCRYNYAKVQINEYLSNGKLTQKEFDAKLKKLESTKEIFMQA